MSTSAAPGTARDSGVERLTAATALDDLRSLLQLCADGALRVSEKTQRPSAATVKTVTGGLAQGDVYPDHAIAAFAWPLLLQAGRLATAEKGRLSLTAAGRRALAAPTPGVVQGLWQRWITHGLIDELSRVEAIKGQRSANALSAVKPRRALVARALAECVGSDWVAVDALFASMRRRGIDPAVVRKGRAIWKLYLEDPTYGSLGYAGFGEWSILQGRYTLAVLLEYAATLGLVDVVVTDPAGARDDFREQWGGDQLDALSRYDGLLAVRRTSLGDLAIS